MVDIFKNINLSGIKGILLDLDNTLYSYESCNKYALRRVYQIFQRTRKIPFDEFRSKYEIAKKTVKSHIKNQAASHSRFLYFQTFFENYFKRTKVVLTLKFEKLYWDSFFVKMILAEGALKFLQKCKKNNIKICLVTDLTARIQFEKVKFLKIDRYVDFIVSSEEAGKEKPQADIFLMAIDKLGLRRRDVLVIGDDYEKDFIGAKRLGLKTFLIKPCLP